MDNPNQIVSLPQFAKDRIRKDDGTLKGEKGDPTRDPAQRGDGLDSIRRLMDLAQAEGDYTLYSENQLLLGAFESHREGKPLTKAQQHTLDMYAFAQESGSRVPGQRRNAPVNPHIRAMEIEEEIRERKIIARGGRRGIDTKGGPPSELHFIGKEAQEQAIQIRKQDLRTLRGGITEQDVR